ncbi:MAG: ABC transporter permease [bacterium]|nr:ABC transporter permease [bacterium]
MLLPLVTGMTFLAFAVMHFAPGDPGTMFMNPDTRAEDYVQIKNNLGLDKPVIIQYFYWLLNVFKGNLGYSYISGESVFITIIERLPATLILSVSSLILIFTVTFPLGLIAGFKKGSYIDHTITVLSFIGLSIPAFWLGLVLIIIFSLKLNLFPTSGFLDPALYSASFFVRAMDVLKHLVLPLATIIIGGVAGLTRYHRFGIISILKQNYITAAYARGISDRIILFKHAFKNAALPVITILGMQLPSLIGGSFIIEYIFSWPGMGQLGISAIFSRDYPVLMGTLLFSSILIITGNLIADIAYACADPRIQYSKK